MDAELYDEFLEKYAAGRHSEQEHRAFQQWLLRASPAQVQAALDRYAELQRYRLPVPPAPADVAALEARLDSLEARPQRVRRWLPAAAVVAGLGLLGGLSYLLRPMAAPAVAYRQYRTGQGQQARLTLPDGSVVRLNGNSSLCHPVAFGVATCDVYLRGEAYFEVAKDQAHPFLVHCGRLQTRVVGTSFDVYAYAPAERLEVTVLTGRVLVADSATGRSVALRPAQKAVLVPTATALYREAAPHPQLSLAWRQGKLRFEQAPLAEITAKLSQRYGVHIGLGSERLRQCRLTVEFGPESLAEALEILTALTGSTYTQQQQQITLAGLGC